MEWLLASSVATSKSKKEEDVAKTTKRRMIVFLVDEIDYLVTKIAILTVLHDLFDWPIRGYE